MVKAQDWLDKNCPDKLHSKWLVKHGGKISGELIISDFPQLEKIDVSGDGLEKGNLTQLHLTNCPQLTELACWNNNLTELTINNCPNLRKITASWNQLTNLDLRANRVLTKLNLYKNKLTHLDLSNHQQLEELNISYNNFTSDLSFLSHLVNLEILYLESNNFTGSLDYLSEMKQLKKLDIRWTDLNGVDDVNRYGWCRKCIRPNTSLNLCQPCAEKEWQEDAKILEGWELIYKFIQQQNERRAYSNLEWIPYKQFTNIELIGEGGFSKIYKAKWNDVWEGKSKVILKSLNNSQKITLEFLTEIANTKSVDDDPSNKIVCCYGISQEPTTKNYVMVMLYIEEGNLRQVLQNKTGYLDLENKLKNLKNIANGLKSIHEQNLIHRDFHSGNILNSEYVTDLGLSQPVNCQKQEDKIFGVLPYIAPEVLRGKPYAQVSDIYSFGIAAYELLANSYPYPDLKDLYPNLKDNKELEQSFILDVIIKGLRPDVDKLKIPQLLKDLIKRCWDANPEKRPTAGEFLNDVYNWNKEIKEKQNTPFYQQYLEIKDEYNTFSQNTPYQIHPTATLTSKPINTKQITEQLSKLQESRQFDLSLDLTQLNIQENNSDWTAFNLNFTSELINQWSNLNFTPRQVKEWLDIGLQPQEAEYAYWLREEIKMTPEQVLNEGDNTELKELFQEYQQQYQSQIQIPPKGNN